MKIVKIKQTTLAAPFNSADTSLVVNALVDSQGNVVALADVGTFAVVVIKQGDTTEIVKISAVVQNADGTATLTVASSGRDILPKSPYTGGATGQDFQTGAEVIVTNDPLSMSTFGNLNEDQTVTGQWTFDSFPITPDNSDASDAVKGVTKLSVAPASATEPIAVGDNDPRIPSADPTTLFAPITFIVPTGGVTMFAGASAPAGWLLCNGASLLRATYAALFAIIGTGFGNADGTHFNVPDMRGRVPVGVGTGIGGGAAGTGLPAAGAALTAIALGTWKGEETHVLIVTELAAHTHTTSIPIPGSSGTTAFNPGYSTANSMVITSSSTGSDTAHNNIQPVMGLNFIIKT